MECTKNKHEFLSLQQINTIREKLIAERERILETAQKDEERQKYLIDRNELSDPVDEASANMQASHDIRVKNRESFYLRKLNKTIQRVNDPEFGLCSECGLEISFERLKARPTAELCIGCKEESEHSEKNNFKQRQSKSLGTSLQEMASR